MKIFKQQPIDLIRVRIYKDNEHVKYLNLCDTTADEVLEMCKQVILKQNLSPFATGKRTSIEVREAKGAKNGKAQSIPFKGLEVDETYELILNAIEQESNHFSVTPPPESKRRETECEDIVTTLNNDIAASGLDLSFTYSTDGYYQAICFNDTVLWSTDNDERDFDEDTQEYIPLLTHIIAQYQDIFGEMSKLNERFLERLR